jgi:hypothetical protein
MVEAARRRSSTASTTPTAPTTNAAAVAVAPTATRVVIPTSVTVPTPRKRKGFEANLACLPQTRRSRPHMWFCSPWPCAALSKVHSRSPATLP